jgi:hypothetical protein
MSSSVDNEEGAAIPSDHAIPDDHTICYHYCGLDRFVSIVRNKTLRLGNLFHMNDAKEVSWLFDIASKRIDDLLAGPDDGEDSSSSFGWHHNALVKLGSLIKGQRFYHVYAACFSARKDDLSQWRGYADDGRGATLGIDLEEVLKQPKCHLLKRVSVIYNQNDAEQRVKEILAPLVDPAGFGDGTPSSSGIGSGPRPAIRVLRELANIAPSFKNPAFKHEAEVRLIVRTSVPPDEDLDPSHFGKKWFAGFPSPVMFSQGRSGLVPFTQVRLPASAVRAVGLGPRFGGYESKVALELFCRKHFPNRQSRFYRSTASYR